jgi:hypothetical protein
VRKGPRVAAFAARFIFCSFACFFSEPQKEKLQEITKIGKEEIEKKILGNVENAIRRHQPITLRSRRDSVENAAVRVGGSGKYSKQVAGQE